MTTTISQIAGDYAIQFGSIGHVGAIYILKHDSAVGNRITLASPENQHLPQSRPLPVRLPPRRFSPLLGRREEVTVAVNTLPYNQPMEFYGSAGIGKTALLRYLAHHPEIAPAFSDGIVYHRLVRHQTVSDLLQVLFNAFYECQTPFKATDMQIRDALKNKKALILLDGATLTREEVDGLLNDLPSCTFLFASLERQLWGEGRAVELVGLPLDDAVALVAQELGHPLSPEERSAAEKLCIALEGHPLRILQAVAIAREEKLSLAVIVQQVQSPVATGTWTREILLSLPQPQKIILALFTALGANVALLTEHITEITELPEVKPALEALLRRNLIQVDGGRYNLTSNLIKEFQQEKWNLTHWMERTTSFFTKWVQQYWGIPEHLLQESDTILRILEWAVKTGRWSDVLHLGRAVQGILALSGQWGSWDLVLKWMLEAARAMGDRAAEAFVLHQLGTRALCLNEIADAQSYLTEALRIREALNDQAGAEVTRHNLNFILEPPPPPPPPPLVPIQPLTPSWIWILTSIIIFLLTLVGLLFLFLKPPSPPSTPPATPTPSPPSTPPATPTPSPPSTPPATPTPSPIPTETQSTPSPSQNSDSATLEFSNNSLSFDKLVVGEPGRSGILTLTSRGKLPVTVQKITLTGTNKDDFEVNPIRSSCKQDTVLRNQGDSCQIQVIFTPKQPGKSHAELAITHTAANSPKQISLSGTGIGEKLSPLQIVTFSANPQNIQPGQRVKLCYSLIGAVRANIDPEIGEVPVQEGCRVVTPEKTTIHTLTAVGQNGESMSQKTTVTVRTPEKPVQILKFESSPSRGNSFQLCYAIANAVSASIDREIGQLKNVDEGCVTVSPRQTTNYTLTAIGPNNQQVRSQTTVIPPHR